VKQEKRKGFSFRRQELYLSSATAIEHYTWTERKYFVKSRKASLLVKRVTEVVGVEAPSGRRGGAGGSSCNRNEPPAARAPGGGRRVGGLLGPVAAEGNGLRRERGAGDEPWRTSRRSRHVHESRARQGKGKQRGRGHRCFVQPKEGDQESPQGDVYPSN
jgi:hypothetical protein